MEAKDVKSLQEAYASIYEGYGKEENEKGEKEEKEEDCVPKSEKGEHNCAKKVCHEQFGEGQCIFGEHAEPDENGFVSHYDVLFGHGVEKNVPVSEMEVLFSESHGGHGKKKTMMAHYEAEGELVDEGVGEKVADILDKGTKKIQGGLEKMGVPINRTPRQMGTSPRGADHMRKAGVGPSEKPTGLNNSADLFDIVKGYLVSEGATEEEVYDMMAHLTVEQVEAIVEQRVDVGGGRTVGPVAGAIRSVLTGKLPKSTTYVPPSTQTPTNRAPAVPASKDDSGKLTDFGAGGGKTKMQQTGMTVGQVERQGRRNRGDYSG